MQPYPNNLALSMSNVLSSQKPDEKISIEKVKAKINGALTLDELKQLPYVELLKIPERKRKVLFENIQFNRPNDNNEDWQELPSFFYSSTNEFLEGLNKLTTNGVSLIEFANLDSRDQCGFVSQKYHLLLLMKNGIKFEKLAEIHIDGLIDIIQWLRLFNSDMLLAEKEDSPAKLKLAEKVATMIDDKITRNRQRLSLT